ncbi:PadR family transcriptional regulator [Cytobacillus purgationiresistens]|uniref:DNA-binding PadR family transcriptional regulator n=1 Tax=Cytobacillus purgationiresistens TaxID=863449 RepID=A0ABU0AH58_9BACI|nr:helix-turn-helix transcriptional regulator [Cytobacillus purgationiresistens]MDQ0270599.1 DNA-binding PadR family transcriptional regulator [Cytobacillus purgationiresistens]
MKKHKLLPLSETMHYILLALREPLHGYAIMQKIEEMSDGDVRIAAGTLYGAIDNLLKHHWIKQVPSNDSRRKVYWITEEGMDILKTEQKRLAHILSLYKGVMEDEEV